MHPGLSYSLLWATYTLPALLFVLYLAWTQRDSTSQPFQVKLLVRVIARIFARVYIRLSVPLHVCT